MKDVNRGRGGIRYSTETETKVSVPERSVPLARKESERERRASERREARADWRGRGWKDDKKYRLKIRRESEEDRRSRRGTEGTEGRGWTGLPPERGTGGTERTF